MESDDISISGCLATFGALSYGLWSFRQGRRQMSQYMMRLRVAAQGFTIVALMVGIGIGATRGKEWWDCDVSNSEWCLSSECILLYSVLLCIENVSNINTLHLMHLPTTAHSMRYELWPWVIFRWSECCTTQDHSSCLTKWSVPVLI